MNFFLRNFFGLIVSLKGAEGQNFLCKALSRDHCGWVLRGLFGDEEKMGRVTRRDSLGQITGGGAKRGGRKVVQEDTKILSALQVWREVKHQKSQLSSLRTEELPVQKGRLGTDHGAIRAGFLVEPEPFPSSSSSSRGGSSSCKKLQFRAEGHFSIPVSKKKKKKN